MNNFLVLEDHNPDIDTDDFAIMSMIRNIQVGEEVNSDHFLQFVKKGIELIRNLEGMLNCRITT